jgi:hypothetical protein
MVRLAGVGLGSLIPEYKFGADRDQQFELTIK